MHAYLPNCRLSPVLRCVKLCCVCFLVVDVPLSVRGLDLAPQRTEDLRSSSKEDLRLMLSVLSGELIKVKCIVVLCHECVSRESICFAAVDDSQCCFEDECLDILSLCCLSYLLNLSCMAVYVVSFLTQTDNVNESLSTVTSMRV